MKTNNINEKYFKNEQKELAIKLYNNIMTIDQVRCIYSTDQDFWIKLDYPNRKCFVLFVDD
jgi:hypothetical protein